MTLIIAMKDKNWKAYIGCDWLVSAWSEIISSKYNKFIQIWNSITWVSWAINLLDIVKEDSKSKRPKKFKDKKDIRWLFKKITWLKAKEDIIVWREDDDKLLKSNWFLTITDKKIFFCNWKYWDIDEYEYYAIWTWAHYAIWIMRYLESTRDTNSMDNRELTELIKRIILTVSGLLINVGWDITVATL